jgi:hypothetical protein
MSIKQTLLLKNGETKSKDYFLNKLRQIKYRTKYP